VNQAGGENPYIGIPSPDWSKGLITEEYGGAGTWSDTHGWSKFSGGNGVLAFLTAGSLAGTKAGSTTMSELPGFAWNEAKNTVKSIKTWLKGEGKAVTKEMVQETEATKSLLKSCFLAGTLVSRYSPEDEHYRELVPIENIRFGDKVWSFNLSTMKWEVEPVLETFRTEYNGDVITINIGSDRIKATGGHPFWVASGDDLEKRPSCDCLPDSEQGMFSDGRWVYARDLQLGDVVISRANFGMLIRGLKTSSKKILVYNFLVDDLHNYAVGENGILVHNTNSPAKPTSSEIRSENIKKGIPENQLGPSGQPKRHIVSKPTLKRAKDAAREEAGQGGSVMQHPNPEKGNSHFHPRKADGTKVRTHYEYPE
jgi:hypothetical protein